jgi:hypothetical protein
MVRKLEGRILLRKLNKGRAGSNILALFLLTIVFVLIPTSNQDDSRKLAEQASDDISRTVNFAESEVVLRAAIVRMQIDVDKNGSPHFGELLLCAA